MDKIINRLLFKVQLKRKKTEQLKDNKSGVDHIEVGQRSEQLKKEDEKVEIGETKPGINLQGYCTNMDCLAAKAKLPVWVNIGFGDVSFKSDKTSCRCPDCGQSTVTSIVKAMIFNSEHTISSSDNLTPVKDNHYQCFYPIKSGLSYEVKAKKIRQHATSLEDLITRSENAMISNEIINLVAELQKYLITVVKPHKVKDSVRLLEKIKCDYNGDYNQVFDVGRFTILCDNATKLQTAVAVMKKAEKFNLIVSEDKDFFERQSKHITDFIILNYMFQNMIHLFYEHIRAWQPKNVEEEDLKQASDETLTKMNDIICEWIDDKGIQKIANRYKSHLDIGILKPPQIYKKSELEINDNAILKMSQFVYEQLCKFIPEKIKGKAIYVILYEYYKKYIIGDKNPASCADFALLLQESRNQEMEEDITILQDLETYIPLQANKYPHIDGEENEKNDTFDCYQNVITFLDKKEEKEEQKKVMMIQGKSGSGKSIFCRYLEETLWNNYKKDSKQPIPVYISFPKIYNIKNEKDIILQSLQGKHISKEIIDAIREKVSFIFIMDGFDEIFDKYNQIHNNYKYFYDRFNLNQWNTKIIITCRSKVLSDEDIKNTLIGTNQNQTLSMYLWPFTKQQMHNYIEKFANMKSKNKKKDDNNWTSQKYKETLNNYPNLQKMVEEPFLLQLILSVLPSLVKQYGAGSRISKAQVYEVFNDQWIDIHSQNIISKLAELRIQMNINKIKSTLKRYCLNLGFDMFHQGNQVAIEPDFQYQHDNDIWSKLDPEMETENKSDNVAEEKKETKTINEIANTLVWGKYFNGDSIAKYVLRRVGDNKYQFLHKSCQEYYAAQKIIFDILSWKPNIITIDNQQFQQQFEIYVEQLSINHKLLNEELGIIQFIAERIHDNNPLFINLKSRLFRIIKSSKNNKNVNIAAANAITVLNSANVNMHNRDWSNIKIPYAILDHAFLEGSNFTNANLTNVRIYQTCLNKTDFTNASMDGIYFGEYAYLEGHTGGVNGIHFSPDGLKIISWSNDKTIRIWDTVSGKQIQLLKGHSQSIATVNLSYDGSKIVSCSWDKTIRIWDVISGQQIQLLQGHSRGVNTAQFSPDGSKIVSCALDKTIRIWDVLSGKQIHLIELHSDWTRVLQFSPDGSKVMSYLPDSTIRIWDVLSGEQIQKLQGHSDVLTGFLFTSNGSKIISCSEDKTIRTWDVLSGQQIQTFQGHIESIRGIQLSSDHSKLLSYSKEKTIRIWDLASEKQIQLLEGHSEEVIAAKFSPDNSRIISTSLDNTIRIWDVLSGKQLQILEGHSGQIHGMEFFPKDSKILSCSEDGTIRIWQVSLERKIQLTEGSLDVIMGARFSLDGFKVIACSKDKTIRLWDVQSGKLIQILEVDLNGYSKIQFSCDSTKIASYASNNAIQIWDVSSGKQLQNKCSAISPDNSKVASSSSDSTVRIWDVFSGKQLQVLEGHTTYTGDVQFSPDGTKIISYFDDNTFRLWDVSSGKQLQLLKYDGLVRDCTFSPDGSKFIFTTSDNKFRVWDVLSGQQLLLLEGHTSGINGVRFSPDGTNILSYSLDKTVRLWEASSGKQIQVLDGYSTYALGAQFSPDGSKLVFYLEDNIIRIWDISSKQQIQLLEGHNGDIIDIQFSPDGSKMMSYSKDKTIRLWGNKHGKIIDITENSTVKCVWKVGIQSFGLTMKDSIWKNATGLTEQEKLLVRQRGGKI
ncbi:hypothetical protein RFI_32426 [Reticulomyxa filosa]|uniref:NACHT domain-containing protein n=1 Tax=Reticulomyxa filosa TaxID=46433 RepID=X6LW81_RETFI|nr:hypothetical protein RFI_32426 [Reticulomyxa filosa]|eukprot:ETO04970.1 hypothetical protein RFI_32426 [Reticulomyxa filosa]